MSDETTSTDGAPAARDESAASGSGERPMRPFTLALDIGGTGLKGSVLDTGDRMVADRVSIPTPYPLPPARLVDTLADLVRPLPSFERVSAGFPGVVRKGLVLTAPQFSTEKGLGSRILPELVEKWKGFPLADELSKRFSVPTRVANDADLQGLAVVSGNGLEFVVTLGTGVGTALFYDGMLAPHLELAHVPFRKGETFNEQLGNATLERIGPKRWRRRVLAALEVFKTLTNFDHCYLGGGNSRHLKGRVEEPYSIVDNVAGILGGLRLWDAGRSIDHRD
ncbi:MAG: ROK family protein [Acidimicrobiales bacterium]